MEAELTLTQSLVGAYDVYLHWTNDADEGVTLASFLFFSGAG